MIQPQKVSFYIYCESEEDVSMLEKTLYDFVSEQYNQGALVTAKKLIATINKLNNNPLVTHFLNGK